MKNPDTRRIASTLSIAFGAAWVTALIAPATFAQQNIERVEITGSSIKRIDAETALPVQVVTRQEIEATGSANVEQFLQGLDLLPGDDLHRKRGLGVDALDARAGDFDALDVL